jgi:putative NADH-flavin reductase
VTIERVLVIGAGGGIGFETVRACLAAGFAVRAFSRSADRSPLRHENLETWTGDALNADDVRAALDGVDAVVVALGVPADRRMLTGPITLFSESARVLVPAMADLGVRRLICVTGFGAGDSRAAIHPLQFLPFQVILGKAYADKSAQERIVKESGLDWTLVRPGVLTNGRATGRYTIRKKPDEWRNGVISRADVAGFIVKALREPGWIGEAPVLTY